MKINKYKIFALTVTIVECSITFGLLILLFKGVDKDLNEWQVSHFWEGLWFIAKQVLSIGNVFLSGTLFKELIKNKEEIVTQYQELKQRLNVNIWIPFKENVKKECFWTIQLFNWIKIQRFYLRCVLKAIAWLLVLSMIKQGLFINGLNGAESEVLFSGILTTIYSLLMALVAVKVVLAVKEVSVDENPPTWKYRKQLLHWVIVFGLFVKYNVFNVATYASVTRQSNLLKMVEPYYSIVISFGLISLSLFLIRKRISRAIDYVETLPGKPLIQPEFGRLLHVHEKWQPFLQLYSLSETYYGDVSYQKQIIKDEYIDPRVGKEQVVTISIRYSPFKETFVMRGTLFAAMIEGSSIGYAVGRQKEKLNKKASEAL
ncbi:hypothetical protein [Enterococcus plantarum]|uniref:hypothetical protein n=1 Tax=Enterococcus plantarum TaxID=1077675 RepID=UPI001A909A01|nr:hypothetical protein [Enterococcus plantarum]MBO0423383.1 hypothetical protein [Enterococcus plantarum]